MSEGPGPAQQEQGPLLLGTQVMPHALTLERTPCNNLRAPLPPDWCQALMTAHVERTGLAEGWGIAYHVFTAARGLLFFSVVVLIGAGWSYMKVGTVYMG